MQCRVIDSFDSKWDRFVTDHNAGTFFHQWKWRTVIQQVFGYEPYYLWIEDGVQIVGLLPLFLVRSALFGKSLVGMPLGVYGGAIATSDEAEKLLLERAVEIARQTRAKYCELRGNPYSDRLPSAASIGAASFKQKDIYYT